MNHRNSMIFLGAVWGVSVLCTLCAGEASGQYSAQSAPTLSPWLSMFNNNRGGVLSNYHEFVRPRQEMYQAYQQQQQQLNRQNTQQRALQGEMNQLLNDGSTDRILAEPRQTKSIGGMQGAGFRQYLHYYQGGMPQGGVPQYATGRRY